MTRGNQRERARAKNLKEAAGEKKKNNMSGSEFAKSKEDQAAIMRAKQDKANAKKEAEAAASSSKK